ncbi:hypothetical protein OHV48_12900 [Acinetobacter baumannii]|nr:hypothetical protein [Acinetobacter baumannii]
MTDKIDIAQELQLKQVQIQPKDFSRPSLTECEVRKKNFHIIIVNYFSSVCQNSFHILSHMFSRNQHD